MGAIPAAFVDTGDVLIDRQNNDRQYIVVHIDTLTDADYPIQICSTDGDGDLVWINPTAIRPDGYVITAR